MSDYDRGVYAPQSDAPLAFDPRQMRGGGPAPVTLIVSVMVLLVIVAGACLFYRHGVRQAGRGPASGRRLRRRDADAAAEQRPSSDASAGLQVYKTEAQSSAAVPAPAPAFAPPPEQPQPLPAARPEPVAVAPLKGEAAPPPIRVVQAPAPVAKPAPLKVAVAKPPALRGPATASADDASDDDAGPAAKPAAPPKATKAAAAADTGAASGANLVQIGAFSSPPWPTRPGATSRAPCPAQMPGKTRKVETTTKDGKTFYRAYVAGFASRADAASFCASLKAAGKPCFVK